MQERQKLGVFTVVSKLLFGHLTEEKEEFNLYSTFCKLKVALWRKKTGLQQTEKVGTFFSPSTLCFFLNRKVFSLTLKAEIEGQPQRFQCLGAKTCLKYWKI